MNRISLIIRQKILSIVFIIISIIGGVFIFWYIISLKEKIPENINYNQIFIAKSDIKKNEKITPELIEEQEIPANIFSGKFIVDKNEIIGEKVTVDILKGEIITRDKLEGRNSGNDFNLSFSSYIPEGLRAVSIPVNFYGDRSLLKEGDRVDLISTYYEPENDILYSETILSEKEIILISGNFKESDLRNVNNQENFLLGSLTEDNLVDSYYENPLIITFYLTGPEAEGIFLAMERGVLNLSICHGN